MQVPATESQPQLPVKPYAYEGLTVQGVTPYRLTLRPNENLEVPDEVGYAIVRRNLAKRLTESRIAIATVGLGLRPAALTVRAHVRARISFAGLARVAVTLRQKESSLTPKPEPPSDDVDPSWQDMSDTNEDMDVEF